MVKNRQTEIKLSHELFKIIRSHALKECDPKEKRKRLVIVMLLNRLLYQKNV